MVCQQGVILITQSLTWDVKLSKPRPHICPGADWEHLIFLHPRSLPKAPLQQWRQYFVTESLRQLGTQRHLWESSLFLFDSPPLSLSLLASQLLSLGDKHCTLTHTYTHTHTQTHRIIHPYTFTLFLTQTH